MSNLCNQCSNPCSRLSDESSGKISGKTSGKISGKTSDPWMTIDNEGDITHLCSYVCYRRGRDKYPKKLWPLIQNKDDFDDIRPIQSNQLVKQSFQYLNYDELLQLSEADVDTYYDDLDNQVTMNPQISEVYHEQEQEDRRVHELEEEWETGSVGTIYDY